MRCAVYARVSVADPQGNGLTSIDVQVEACRAYIKSQRGLGWVVVEPAYKDEGVTGATLKRPGLRTLLDDIRQDKIDVVVVHRLDRLSRSLFDLSELIPLLRVQRVELVSVTQQLDTQTPNGRLSLNLLTSFAEFEREIIGERTREKVAATRGKGLWQGKGTPLGYGVDFEQRLVVIAHEADLVRDVFRQYLGLDSMTELMELLQRRRVKNKKWITRDAKPRGGQLLDRTAVYRILGNRIYIGEAYFNGEWHSGVYPPIIDIELSAAWRTAAGKKCHARGWAGGLHCRRPGTGRRAIGLAAELGDRYRVACAAAFPEHQFRIDAVAGEVGEDRFGALFRKRAHATARLDAVDVTGDDDRANLHVLLLCVSEQFIDLVHAALLEDGTADVERALALHLRLQFEGAHRDLWFGLGLDLGRCCAGLGFRCRQRAHAAKLNDHPAVRLQAIRDLFLRHRRDAVGGAAGQHRTGEKTDQDCSLHDSS